MSGLMLSSKQIMSDYILVTAIDNTTSLTKAILMLQFPSEGSTLIMFRF
jgi:hypothetical protein